MSNVTFTNDQGIPIMHEPDCVVIPLEEYEHLCKSANMANVSEIQDAMLAECHKEIEVLKAINSNQTEIIANLLEKNDVLSAELAANTNP